MKRPATLALFLGLALLAGCSSAVEPQPAAPSSFIRLVPTPPPQVELEPIPTNPDPLRLIWRPGYWKHDGSAYAWVAGTFIEKPSLTAAWSADRWERREFGYAFVPGHWQ